MENSSLFQIVYVSAAVAKFTASELLALLAVSRTNNTRDGVSGLLLYHDGNFMQVLEGPEAVVRATYARIERDSRHRGCIILIQQNIAARTFGDWSMAFRELDLSPGEVAGFSEFLNADASLPRDPSRAWKLLTSFRAGLR